MRALLATLTGLAAFLLADAVSNPLGWLLVLTIGLGASYGLGRGPKLR